MKQTILILVMGLFMTNALAQETFIIDAAAFVGGTISPSGEISVSAGSNRTFTSSVL